MAVSAEVGKQLLRQCWQVQTEVVFLPDEPQTRAAWKDSCDTYKNNLEAKQIIHLPIKKLFLDKRPVLLWYPGSGVFCLAHK